MAPDQLRADAASDCGEHLDRRAFLSAAVSASAGAAMSCAGLGAAFVPAVAGEVAASIPALAQVSVPTGAISIQQRQAMVAGITRVLADATGAGPAWLPYITVLVVETAEGGWGVAGHGYVRSEFPALVAGRPLPPGTLPDRAR